MEYYDSINNSLLHSHYSQRNINLLTNPEVVKVLETSFCADNDKKTNLNLLEETPYKIVDKEEIKKKVYKQNTLKNLFDDVGRSSSNNFSDKQGDGNFNKVNNYNYHLYYQNKCCILQYHYL